MIATETLDDRLYRQQRAAMGLIPDVYDRIMDLPLMTRAASYGGVNREQRLIHFSFSSTEPARREYGWEVLDHRPGACDVSRITQGACPFLRQHDWTLQAGKVVSCQLTPYKNYGVAKLFSTSVGEELLTEISEGRTEISCSYIIKNMELAKSTPDHSEDTYVVTNFEIVEISSVSVPADIHVGVNRGLYPDLHQCRVMERSATTRSPTRGLTPEQIEIELAIIRLEFEQELEKERLAAIDKKCSELHSFWTAD
jgi:hypothetical protein